MSFLIVPRHLLLHLLHLSDRQSPKQHSPFFHGKKRDSRSLKKPLSQVSIKCFTSFYHFLSLFLSFVFLSFVLCMEQENLIGQQPFLQDKHSPFSVSLFLRRHLLRRSYGDSMLYTIQRFHLSSVLSPQLFCSLLLIFLSIYTILVSKVLLLHLRSLVPCNLSFYLHFLRKRLEDLINGLLLSHGVKFLS